MEEHIDTLKGIILPFANFFIFLSLAIYFFRKPARAAAAARRAGFEKLMAEARAAKEEALAKLADLKKRELALETELAEIREIARSTAQMESDKILADAERMAKHLQAEAKRIAEAEVNNARQKLRREIVDAVHSGVSQKLKVELGVEAQRQLVRSKTNEMKQLHADN
ncbi:MAG: hypothetical protein NTZ90_06600 [Proteobacteria bacterium]|nr:hypothetical protein [Pseudomonadota bacterium]